MQRGHEALVRAQAARRGEHLATPYLVTTDFTAAPSPMSSTGSPACTRPFSIAPVTTVPRPVMVMEFCTAIRNGASMYRSGTGTYLPIPRSARTFVMAAVNVVFPWSTCPIVPMLRCGLSRMYACLVMTDLLLIPPAALADPARAHRGARCATLPRQVNQANGEGSASPAAAASSTGKPSATAPHSDAHRLTRNAAKMILVACNIDVHPWLGAVVFRLSGNER
jgi:hypothetical protein